MLFRFSTRATGSRSPKVCRTRLCAAFFLMIAALVISLQSGCDDRRSSHTPEPQAHEATPTEATPAPVPKTPSLRPKRTFYDDGKLTMSTQYRTDEDFVFEVTGAPPFVHALPPKPERMEQELKDGVWLVVVFAVVSIRDVKCLPEAIRAVGRRKDKMQLGIRPFLDYDETKSWLDGFRSTLSPLWVVIKDGKVIHIDEGPYSEEGLLAMLKRIIPE